MSNHTDLDRLIFAFLDGAITEEQSRALRKLFDANEENLKRFVRLTDMQVALTGVASTADATDSEKAGALPRPLMRIATAARKSEPARGGQSRVYRWNLLPLAAAAAVLAIVGVYFLFTQAGPRGVDKLIAQARSVRTVADMKALNGPSQEAYQRELAQREGCNLMRLVSLGLATAITGNPREDRQAEDLRFVLEQAGKAGAEWQVARRSSGWGSRLISVAEAAIDVSSGGGITATEHHGFRETYAKARELAGGLYYDQYIQTLETATAHLSPDSLLRQAVGFEGGYVYLYERKFARGGLAYADGHIQGSPYHEYYLQRLRPSLVARAKREQELEDNLDLRNQAAWETFGDGRWTLSETNGYLVIAQTNKDAKDAYLYLGGKSFQEAVFTGFARIEGFAKRPPYGFGCLIHFANNRCQGAGAGTASVNYLRMGEWLRFRLHVSHRDGNCWVIRTEHEFEGKKKLLDSGELLFAKPFMLDRAGVGVNACGVRVEWANLGLEVLRP